MGQIRRRNQGAGIKLGKLPTLPALPPLVQIGTTSVIARDRSAEYLRIREEVLEEAKYRCRCPECKESKHPKIAHEVDHIVPLWRGGAATEKENLQAMNRECHAKKTAEERAERLALGIWAGLKYP